LIVIRFVLVAAAQVELDGFVVASTKVCFYRRTSVVVDSTLLGSRRRRKRRGGMT
jgi:hypothetical protein